MWLGTDPTVWQGLGAKGADVLVIVDGGNDGKVPEGQGDRARELVGVVMEVDDVRREVAGGPSCLSPRIRVEDLVHGTGWEGTACPGDGSSTPIASGPGIPGQQVYLMAACEQLVVEPPDVGLGTAPARVPVVNQEDAHGAMATG